MADNKFEEYPGDGSVYLADPSNLTSSSGTGDDAKDRFIANRIAYLRTSSTSTVATTAEEADQTDRVLKSGGSDDAIGLAAAASDPVLARDLQAIDRASEDLRRAIPSSDNKSTESIKLSYRMDMAEGMKEMADAIINAATESAEQLPDASAAQKLAVATALQLGATKSGVVRKAMRDDFLAYVGADLVPENYDGWDIATDVAGQFLSFRQNWAERFRYDGDVIADMQDFHSMSYAEQVKAAPGIVAKIDKAAGDNTLLKIGMWEVFQEKDLIGDHKGELTLDLVFGALDVVGLAGIPKMLSKASRARKIGGIAKFTATSGARNRAANLVAEAAVSGEKKVEDLAGVTQHEAVSLASPFALDNPVAREKAFDGLSPDIQQAIEQRMQLAREHIRSVGDQKTSLGIMGPINDPLALEEANQRIVKQYAGEAKITKQLPNGVEIEVRIANPAYSKAPPDFADLDARLLEQRAVVRKMREDMGDEAFAMSDAGKAELTALKNIEDEVAKAEEYITEARKGPWVYRTETYRYTKDDVGTMRAEEVHNVLPSVQSKEPWVNQLHKDVVQESEVLNFQKETFSRAFFNAAKESVSGLNLKSRKKLSDILLRGDRESRVYSARELYDMGLVQNDEIAAYYSQRALFDELHRLKEEMEMTRAEFNKLKKLSVKLPDKTNTIALASYDNATMTFPQGVRRMYDASRGRVVDVLDTKAEYWADRIGKGERIAKFDRGLSWGDETVNYAIVKENHFKDIRSSPLLNYKTGYVPLFRKNIFYTVRQEGLPRLIDGVKTNTWKKTVRLFDSKLEAEAWAKEQQELTGITHRAHYSRELADVDPDYRRSVEDAYFGGPYTGRRAEDPPPFGRDGLNEAERITAPEALERYMNHIASAMPVSQWRMGLIQEYLNTARPYLRDKNDWLSPLDGLPAVDRRKDTLERYRTWIQTQIGMGTTEERLWGMFTKTMGEFMDRGAKSHSPWVPSRAIDAIRLRTLNEADKPALAARIRSATNHIYLGMLNVAQLPVQFMNVATVFSRHPFKTTNALGKYLALRLTMYARNDPEFWAEAAKMAEINPAKFKAMMSAYHKAGVVDSVWSNADLQAARHGLSVTADFRQAASRTSMFIYREAELASRSAAWIVEYDKLIASKPKGYVLTDADIRQVTKGMLKWSLNLGPSNRAEWQKGLLSIPTQYMQVGVKFFENLLPDAFGGTGNWTLRDKLSVWVGSVILFGAQGFPFGEYLVQADLDRKNDTKGATPLSENGSAFFNGGMTELSFQLMVGESPDVADRVALMKAMTGVVTDLSHYMTGDTTGYGNGILHAFGGAVARVWDEFNILMPIVGTSTEVQDERAAMNDVVLSLLRIPSSGRNAWKAALWHERGYMTDVNGNFLAPLDDEDGFSQVAYQAVGLTPRELSDLYALRKGVFDDEEYIRDVTDAYESIIRMYATSDLEHNPKYRADVQKRISWLLNHTKLTAEGKEKVINAVGKRLEKNEYELLNQLLDKARDVRDQVEGTRKYEGNEWLQDRSRE